MHTYQELPPSPSASPSLHDRTLEPAIEDYLDHVCAPLVGRVSYARRQALRAELTEHLDALIEAREELGESHDQAVWHALKQFGEPDQIAHQWMHEWVRTHSHSQTMWEAARQGMRCYIPAALVGWWLVADMSHRGVTGVELGGFAIAVPIICGCIVGLRVQRWRLLAGCVGPAAITLVSALIALTLYSDGTDPFANLAPISFVAWLPISTIAAELAGWARSRWARGPGPWRLQQV